MIKANEFIQALETGEKNEKVTKGVVFYCMNKDNLFRDINIDTINEKIINELATYLPYSRPLIEEYLIKKYTIKSNPELFEVIKKICIQGKENYSTTLIESYGICDESEILKKYEKIIKTINIDLSTKLSEFKNLGSKNKNLDRQIEETRSENVRLENIDEKETLNDIENLKKIEKIMKDNENILKKLERSIKNSQNDEIDNINI